MIVAYFALKNEKIVREKLASEGLKERQLSGKLKPTKVIFGLILLAFLFGIIGLSNPQWGFSRQKVEAKSADVFIALDLSNSMMAQDILPNRLDRAKRFASQLTESLKGERIGLIYFAGNAYLQMPLTTDYATAKLMLQSAHTNLVGTQGTAIGDVIELAQKSFDPQSEYHKTLVLITDGEDHEDQAIQLARQATDQDISIFTVGVGSASGAQIPIETGSGIDWKRDQSGQVVTTRLNQDMLIELASVSGGQFFQLNNDQRIVSRIKTAIDAIDKQVVEAQNFTDFNSYFQIFVGLCLLILLVEWAIRHQLLPINRLK